MDGDLIDAVLKPFLDQLLMASDERDIDEPDADEEVVFKTPIVGGSASLFSQRNLCSHLMNKIHAVDFKLDGSGVVNILDTDGTRDPKKLELRKGSTTWGVGSIPLKDAEKCFQDVGSMMVSLYFFSFPTCSNF